VSVMIMMIMMCWLRYLRGDVDYGLVIPVVNDQQIGHGQRKKRGIIGRKWENGYWEMGNGKRGFP